MVRPRFLIATGVSMAWVFLIANPCRIFSFQTPARARGPNEMTSTHHSLIAAITLAQPKDPARSSMGFSFYYKPSETLI
jgi:hypothetical protein